MLKSINSNILISAAVLFAGVLIAVALMGTGVINVQASSLDDIIYPIEELGGCENESECKSYCDDIEHIGECLAFAEVHNLMTLREIKEARHFSDAGIRQGPGGCTTQRECKAYCEDVNNIEECLSFAEEHDILPREELEEARKIARALRSGAELPGGCTSKESCEVYCQDSAHIEECIAFSEKAGFISPEELAEIRRILPLIKSGQMPGGCTSKRQCEAYCDDDSHIDECVLFAERAGFMSPEEAEMARRTGGRGPGGCRRDECEVYCSDVEHQDECFAFAKEHGLISEEDLVHMKDGAERIKQGLEHASPEVLSCLEDKVGINVVDDIREGTFSPSRSSGEAIKGCFEQFMTRPNFPPEVEHCIIEMYGADAMDRMMRGELNPQEIEGGIGLCVNELMRDRFEGEGFDSGARTFEGEFGGVGGEHDSIDSFRERFDEDRLRIETEFRLKFEDEHNDEHDGFDDHSEFDDNSGFDDGGSIQTTPIIQPSIQLDAPTQTERCFIKLYGLDYEKRIASGELNIDDMKAAITKCMEESIETQLRQTSSAFEAIEHFLNR